MGRAGDGPGVRCAEEVEPGWSFPADGLPARLRRSWVPWPRSRLAAGGTAGAEPADDPLAGTFADVALVTPPEGETGAALPRLLVVRAPDPTDPGTVVLDLLQADGDGWTRVDRLSVATGLDAPGPATLIPLSGRFAVLATDLGGKTYVGLIAENPTGLRQDAKKVEVLGRVGAGAADVDGDGSAELVLVGNAVSDGVGGCLWSPLVVMNGETLKQVVSSQIPGIGLDGGAIGHFGTAPGEDLLAYAHAGCAPEQRSAPDSVAVIDLATGGLDPSLRIHTYRPVGEGSYVGPGRIDVDGVAGPVVPLVADLDGDGIDEAILRSGPAVVILDPAQGWRAEVVDENATPLAVVDPADHPRLVVAKPAADGESGGIRLLALGRVGRGGELIERGVAAIPPRPSDRSAGSPLGVDLATDPAAPPPVWVGELGTAGCQVVLVPSATFLSCSRDAIAWSGRLGPAWLQTVPLAAFGENGSTACSWRPASAGRRRGTAPRRAGPGGDLRGQERPLAAGTVEPLHPRGRRPRAAGRTRQPLRAGRHVRPGRRCRLRAAVDRQGPTG